MHQIVHQMGVSGCSWVHLTPLPGVHQSIKKPRLGLGSLDGAKRIRTADPLHAMQVLYQLSYGPDRTPWHGMLVIPLGFWPCLTHVELTTPPV